MYLFLCLEISFRPFVGRLTQYIVLDIQPRFVLGPGLVRKYSFFSVMKGPAADATDAPQP